jgi:DNA invertase Pin-like site-specific DNA recombinase
LGQKKAALYCRVSTVDQSCECQERELLAYAKRAKYSVVGIWKETASRGKNSRPERKQVMAMAQARRIDVILVWGRSMLDLVGRPHERQNKVRLGLPRIIRPKEDAPEFDYSSFYGKTGAEIHRFVVEV